MYQDLMNGLYYQLEQDISMIWFAFCFNVYFIIVFCLSFFFCFNFYYFLFLFFSFYFIIFFASLLFFSVIRSKTKEAIKTDLTSEQLAQFNERKPALLKRGQISIHHGLTVHGSYGNHANASRRAAVLNFFNDGTVSNTEESLLLGIPVYKKGEKLEGQFFPFLFDAELITKGKKSKK
jgi:hypothetical protein